MFGDVLAYVLFFYGAGCASRDIVSFASRKIKSYKLKKQLDKAVSENQ